MARNHFYGGAEHKLDDKNRITVPVQFRAGLGDKFYLCKGMNDRCLWILPQEEFGKVLDDMKQKVPKSDKRGQRWIALFTESAVDRQMDRFNRITIPASLLEYADINNQVKIYGHDERIEIWALEKWEDEVMEDFSELSAEMFQAYNI